MYMYMYMYIQVDNLTEKGGNEAVCVHNTCISCTRMHTIVHTCTRFNCVAIPSLTHLSHLLAVQSPDEGVWLQLSVEPRPAPGLASGIPCQRLTQRHYTCVYSTLAKLVVEEEKKKPDPINHT